MDLSNIPYKFQYVWGQNATTGFVTDPIPVTTTSPAASQSLGFPPATSVPIAGGGTPPNIDDFNGALFYATSWIQWAQAGGPIQYDSTFSGNVGGYPNGAVIASATVPIRQWQSTVDNNTSDPDTGGANWIIANLGRLINVQVFTTGGTYTPTAGMNFIIAEAQGAGGGGAGVTLPSVGNVSLGAPGTSGSYAKGKFTAAQIGASQSITTGTGGSGGGSSGGNGGPASIGTLLIAPGGIGGGTLGNQTPPTVNGNGTNAASPTGGNIVSSRGGGASPTVAVSATTGFSGLGGPSVFGPGGFGVSINANGPNAVCPGAGGGGCLCDNGGGGSFNGGAGANGIVIIWEYS